MAVNLRSDGKAVDVVIPAGYAKVTKGDLILAEGWYGVAMNDGVKGDTIAIETTQREFVFTVGGSITAAKGDVLYLSNAGAITNTDTDTPVLKVTKAKDSNNVIWAKLLPQMSQERSKMKDFNFHAAALEAEQKVIAEMREHGKVTGLLS